ERVAVDRDSLADDARIGAEAIAPIVVAENGDHAVAAAAYLVVVGRDHAAERGADAEYIEVGAGHELAGHPFGLPVDSDVERHGAAAEDARKNRLRRRRSRERQGDARQ